MYTFVSDNVTLSTSIIDRVELPMAARLIIPRRVPNNNSVLNVRINRLRGALCIKIMAAKAAGVP